LLINSNTTFYTTFTREVEFDSKPQKGLYSMDSETGQLRADAVVEFCKVPRRQSEIERRFGLGWKPVKDALTVLVADGKIKTVYPLGTHHKQMYARADSDAAITEAAMVLELCMVPRTKYEIGKRLGIKAKDIGRVVKPLIASGELLLAVPDAYRSQNQMLVSARSEYKEGEAFSEQALLEFCMTARSSNEISEHFSYIGKQRLMTYINASIQGGKLSKMNPTLNAKRNQKYITVK
jgi:hypothetical protein